MYFVSPTVLNRCISEITRPYTSWPDDRDIIMKEAWERYYTGFKILNNAVTFWAPMIVPALPLSRTTVQFMSSLSLSITNWQTFKNIIMNGIQGEANLEINTAVIEEVNNINEGAKNFFQFWLRFFYLVLHFDTMLYSDAAGNIATCSPVSAIVDSSVSQVPFYNSFTAKTIKNILESIIILENDRTVKVKYAPPIGSCSGRTPRMQNGYFILNDFTPENCYFEIIINSIIRNFFSGQYFLIPVKIIALTLANTPVIPNPNNVAAPSFIAILE